MGPPLTFVKDQLRHSSIQITADVYGHLLPRAHRETLDAIDALAGRKVTSDGVERSNVVKLVGRA